MMKLQAFRIRNFRSIVDTGFKNLSPDGISLIVGQNESGKSSILDGMYAFETGVVSEDDIRSNGAMPEVTCIFKFPSYDELLECIPEEAELPKNFKKTFESLDNCIALKRIWSGSNYKSGKLEVENEKLKSLWVAAVEAVKEEAAEAATPEDATAEVTPTEEKSKVITDEEFIKEVFSSLPMIDMFEDNSLLPPKIDLDDLIEENTEAEGYEGAKNFLLIADIDPQSLLKPASTRIVEDMLEEKNKKINAELQKYWHQTVGKKDKIEVILELKYHSTSTAGKEGHPYLMFWIRDKNGRLSPLQRSKGVKWFISFYLKLEATAAKTNQRVFLIDEPGANLHAKAQKDILSVFEKQKDNLQIIFTTHSPYLLDIEKVYRVLAVERQDTEDEKSETKVIPFQDLGSASVDTMMPLFTNMGVDASHQTVIAKENNVLLEEISAFFYLKAFWKVFGKTEKVHFIPATGCPNLPLMANLMLGWGLSFSIVLDDEPHGRKVLKELKESMVCDPNNLLKIDDCPGIEDLFSKADFTKLILKKATAKITTTNSEFVKTEKLSKVILARDFMIAVNDGSISLSEFSLETKEKVEKLLSRIIGTLNVPKAASTAPGAAAANA